MRKTVMICDRCQVEYNEYDEIDTEVEGKTQTIKKTRIGYNSLYNRPGISDTLHVRDHLDLCPNCAKEFFTWLSDTSIHIHFVKLLPEDNEIDENTGI